MQATKNLGDLLAHLAVIAYDIHNFKRLSIDSGRSPEYNLCNQIRVDFYKFRQKFLDELARLIEGEEFDFSFVSNHRENIEEQLHQLVALEDVESVDGVCHCLDELTKIVSALIDKAQNLHPEEKSGMQDRLIFFQYSMMYYTNYQI